MKRKLIAIAVATALTTATSLISAQQGKLSDDVVKIGVSDRHVWRICRLRRPRCL